MLERNQRKRDDSNPVLAALKDIDAKPEAILEIGCSRGHRLIELHQEFGAECCGVDPSEKAIEQGRALYPALVLEQGTADSLQYPDDRFDVVIFGFCLYLCDPRDHFRIAWQADRILQDGGFLVIHDFLTLTPYRNKYVHSANLSSYKMEWSRMFTWNPAFQLISRRYMEHAKPLSFAPDEQICVEVLHKDSQAAFPNNPYRQAAAD